MALGTWRASQRPDTSGDVAGHMQESETWKEKAALGPWSLMLPWGLARLSGRPHKNYPQASFLEACEHSEGQVGLLCLLSGSHHWLTTHALFAIQNGGRLSQASRSPGARAREKPARALPVMLALLYRRSKAQGTLCRLRIRASASLKLEY